MRLGYQRWDDVLFFHWPVPAATLREKVDPRLEIDTYAGEAWLSLTPFTLRGARLVGMPPVPFVSHFHETNLRTYVRHRGRAGIWFFSLDAANAVASAAARAAFGLPYFAARMARTTLPDGARLYALERRGGAARLAASWFSGNGLPEQHAGSLTHFLVERYSLFSRWLGGALLRVDVAHRRWPLQEVFVENLRQTVSDAAGVPPPGEAVLAHGSPGVDVRFTRLVWEHRGRRARRAVPAPAAGATSSANL